MAAMPIHAQIARSYPQPGDKARIPVWLKFEESAKAILCEALADEEVTIRSRIFI